MKSKSGSQVLASINNQIRPGWFFSVHGHGEFQILPPDPESNTRLVIPAENIASHEKRIFTVSEFDELAAKNVPAVFAPSLEQLRELQRTSEPEVKPTPRSSASPQSIKFAEQIFERVRMINELLADEERNCKAAGVPFYRDKAIRRICQNLRSVGRQFRGYGRTNYYGDSRMIKHANWDVTKLALDLHRNTFGATKMSRAQIHLVDAVILQHGASRGFTEGLPSLYSLLQGYHEHTDGWWVDPEKCTDIPLDLVNELMNVNLPIEVILANPEKAALLSQIELPSQAWFYRHYHWFTSNPEQSGAEMIKKYGREFYETHLMVFDSYVRRASLPLEYIFADHCYLDIFVVDEESRKHVFRIWVTLLIDAFSRAIVGMALLLGNPSIESIQSALANAVWDKKGFLKDLGLEYPEGKGWECYGIPISLSLDNAWAHHSLSLEALCRNISFGGRYNSIELDFRPPYNGHYGGLIERFLGNLQNKLKVSMQIGTIRRTGPATEPGAVRNAAKEATYLIKDIKKAIAQLIVIYMHTPHRELNGMTPHEKWLEGMQSGWPKVPARTPDNERLFWCGYPDTRIITDRGISAFGLTYWAPELQTAQRVDENGDVIRYSFTYKPSDISRIALFREGHYICDLYAKELRQADDSYKHPGLAERKLALRLAEKSGESGLAWLKFVQEAQQLGKQRQAEQKAARKAEKRQKRKQPPSNSVTTAESSSQLERLKRFSGGQDA